MPAAPVSLKSVLKRDFSFLSGVGTPIEVLLMHGQKRIISDILLKLRFCAFEGLVRVGTLNLGPIDGHCGYDAQTWDATMLYVGGEDVNVGLVTLVKMAEFLHVWNVQPEELLTSLLVNFVSPGCLRAIGFVVEALIAMHQHSSYLVSILGDAFEDDIRSRFHLLSGCDLTGFPEHVLWNLTRLSNLGIRSESDVLAVVRKWGHQNGGCGRLLDNVRPCVPKRTLCELYEGVDKELCQFAFSALARRRRGLECREGDPTLHPDLFGVC